MTGVGTYQIRKWSSRAQYAIQISNITLQVTEICYVLDLHDSFYFLSYFVIIPNPDR